MEVMLQSADCSSLNTYFAVFAANIVVVTITVAIGVFATCKLLYKQYEIYRQGSTDGTNYSSSLLIAHALFFLICIICSVSRLLLINALCSDARSDDQSEDPTKSFLQPYLTTYVSSYLLHWTGLILIHTQRLRQVFDGTNFEASARYPAISASMAIFSIVVFALNFIGFAFHVDALQRVRRLFASITVVGLVISSKIVAMAFIVKFHQFNNAMAGVDLDGDCIDFVRLMTKSTILAVGSLITSSTVILILALILNVQQSLSTLSAWYYVMSSHSLDMLTNCVCIYLSLSVGSRHYDVLCEPLHRRCQEFCLRMSRNRRIKAHGRKKEITELQNTTAELSVQPTVEGTATKGETATTKEAKLEEEEEQAGKEMEELRRMRRRVSFNVSSSLVRVDVAPPFAPAQRRSCKTLTNTNQLDLDIKDVRVLRTERKSVPIRSKLQIGVGVLTNEKSPVLPGIVEIGGRAVEMDAEEELT